MMADAAAGSDKTNGKLRLLWWCLLVVEFV
jgi:hypothetical protein